MGSQISSPEPGRRPLPFKAASARLESWKEIAAYFRRDIRTVQRWERTEGLPVHRHSHAKGGTVFAEKRELDLWWESRHLRLAPDAPATARQNPPWKLAWIAAGLTILAIPLAWKYWPAAGRSRVAAPRLASIPGRLFANATSEGRSLHWIRVGEQPVAAIAAPDQSRVYVSNLSGGTVSVISTSRDTVLATIRVGGRPGALAMDPQGQRLYVANEDGYLSEVNLAGNSVRVIPAGAPVTDLALAPDSRSLYLATGFHGLLQLSLPDYRAHPVGTAPAPMFLTALPDGSRLYINYQAGGPGGRAGHDAIDILDLSTSRFAGAISGFPNVGGPIAASPDGGQVWASGSDACSAPQYDHAGCPLTPGDVIHVIRPSDNRIIRTFGLPASGLGSISFFPDGSRAVLAASHGPLRVVDTTRFAAVETLPLSGAGKIAFTAGGRLAWCPVAGRNAVAVFDLSARSCLPPPSGLVAWWTGDGTSEDVTAAAHAAAPSAIGFAPGIVGQAFRLDGSVSLGLGPPTYGPGQEESTVALWAKLLAVETAETTLLDFVRLTAPGHDGEARGWRVAQDRQGYLELCRLDNLRQAGCPRADSARGRKPLSATLWTHLALVRNAAGVSLYRNGVPEAAIPAAGLPAAVNVTLRFGSFRGLADEIQWFGRTLSSAELLSIVQAGAAGLCYNGAAGL